ncbi:MAG: hypothetical protein CEE38_05065 [Planctomycetes bacterium B3_Pla]|nr:MAG: hypothetical protein CEE38_05065 [Planctomycetes bacterium B3_Pla]
MTKPFAFLLFNSQFQTLNSIFVLYLSYALLLGCQEKSPLATEKREKKENFATDCTDFWATYAVLSDAEGERRERREIINYQ